MQHLLSVTAVELAEEGIAVLPRPIAEMGNEVFDVLADCLTQGFGPTEIGGVCFHQDGIQEMGSRLNLVGVSTPCSG